MKKLTALLLAGLLTLACVSCGTTPPAADPAPAPSSEAPVETPVVTEPIKIATKPMTEQYILGEMLKQTIEAKTDYTVEITKGIGGGTSNIHPAMVAGEFDLYPEYTSTGWIMVLKHAAGEVSDAEMLGKLDEEYNEQFDMSWVGELGFNNTYAVVVRKEIADKYNLTTTSDMAAVSGELVFGGNPDYIEREDGFPRLCETYGLDFKAVRDIDVGLKYAAMESKDIDVTNGFTTDAQLGRDDVLVLEDDLHLQVNYFCSTIVRNEALENYPGLREAIEGLNLCLSDKEMAGLNYQVEVEGLNEADVARDYLESKGII